MLEIKIDLEKKCKRCKKGGACQNGYCLAGIAKMTKEKKFDHIIKMILGTIIGDSIMSRQIKLTQGQIAIVDDEDYEWLNKYKWYAQRDYSVRDNWYAVRREKSKKILMHRQILDVPQGMETDHQNHNGLDNRKINIRICTASENQHNQQRQKGASKYKGVCWHKSRRKWQARIGCNNRLIHLGLFANETEAALVYDKKAKQLHGEFAYTNFGD